MNLEERRLLTLKLFSLLVENPEKNKYELIGLLQAEGIFSFTTSDINSVLYGNTAIFKKDNQTLPLWETCSAILNNSSILQASKVEALNLSRYKGHTPRAWQTEALDRWIHAGRKGVIEAVTGTGKTSVGIIAAADALARNLRVLILVPGTDLLDQWHRKLSSDLKGYTIGRFCSGHNDNFLSHKIIVATVQSACRYQMLPDKHHGLIIADEVHHYGSEKFSLALEEAFEERLGLTATYDRNDNGIDEVLSPYFLGLNKNATAADFVIHGCGFSRGLSDGILAPFRVGLLGLNFDADEQEAYDYLDGVIKKKRRKLISDYGCPVEPFGEFMAYVQKLKKGELGDIYATITASGYLKSFSERRRLLAESKTKEHAIDLLKYVIFMANRSLIFTETKESAVNVANQLCGYGIEALDFSSDLNKNERNERMLAFENGSVTVLCSPKVLDEGIDMPEADLGIILAASKTKRQMIQRMGRILRPKKDGRPATFIIVYMRNTSEDPEFGAHEAFLGEMLDHAEDVTPFKEDISQLELAKWFIGGTRNQI